jgi:hypothetical protein
MFGNLVFGKFSSTTPSSSLPRDNLGVNRGSISEEGPYKMAWEKVGEGSLLEGSSKKKDKAISEDGVVG